MPKRWQRVTEEEVINCVREGYDTPEKARKALGLSNSNAIRQHFFRLTRRGVLRQRPDGGYNLVGNDDYADERDDGREYVEALFEDPTTRQGDVRSRPRTGAEECEEPRGSKARRDTRSWPEETRLATGSEDVGWPAEKVYSLVKDNILLGWAHGTGERPTANVVNELVAEFLAGHGLPPVFPRGFRVSPKGLPQLLAAAYQEGLECGRAYAAEVKRERHSPEYTRLEQENTRLREENFRLANQVKTLQNEVENYRHRVVKLMREGSLEKAELRKRIAELEQELKRLHVDKSRRELCALVQRLTAELEQERRARVEATLACWRAERAYNEALAGIFQNGQLEKFLYQELNSRLAQSLVGLLR